MYMCVYIYIYIYIYLNSRGLSRLYQEKYTVHACDTYILDSGRVRSQRATMSRQRP